jgi:hypothetical protein
LQMSAIPSKKGYSREIYSYFFSNVPSCQRCVLLNFFRGSPIGNCESAMPESLRYGSISSPLIAKHGKSQNPPIRPSFAEETMESYKCHKHMTCELGGFMLTERLKFLNFFGISKGIKKEKRYCQNSENVWLFRIHTP